MDQSPWILCEAAGSPCVWDVSSVDRWNYNSWCRPCEAEKENQKKKSVRKGEGGQWETKKQKARTRVRQYRLAVIHFSIRFLLLEIDISLGSFCIKIALLYSCSRKPNSLSLLLELFLSGKIWKTSDWPLTLFEGSCHPCRLRRP